MAFTEIFNLANNSLIIQAKINKSRGGEKSVGDTGVDVIITGNHVTLYI